jgi:hypothetical protein
MGLSWVTNDQGRYCQRLCAWLVTLKAEVAAWLLALARNANLLEQIRAGIGGAAKRCAFWTTDITYQELAKNPSIVFARTWGRSIC